MSLNYSTLDLFIEFEIIFKIKKKYLKLIIFNIRNFKLYWNKKGINSLEPKEIQAIKFIKNIKNTYERGLDKKEWLNLDSNF